MPKKSQKGRLGPVGPECQKSAEKDAKVSKKSLFATFSAHLRLFRHFLGTPGRQARDDLFETFFGISGPEDPAFPVTGRYNRNAFLEDNTIVTKIDAGCKIFFRELILYQRRRDDNKNKICSLEGGALGPERTFVQKRCILLETPRQ